MDQDSSEVGIEVQTIELVGVRHQQSVSGDLGQGNNFSSLDLLPSTLHLFFPFALHVYSRLFVAQISGLRAISALPRTEINCRDAGRVSRGAYNRYRCRVDVIKNPMPDMAGQAPAKTTCHFSVVMHLVPFACCTGLK